MKDIFAVTDNAGEVVSTHITSEEGVEQIALLNPKHSTAPFALQIYRHFATVVSPKKGKKGEGS